MILWLLLSACHSVHSVLALSDANTELQKQRNARTAASVAASPGLVLFNQQHIRAGALESLGRLGHSDARIVSDVLSVLNDPQLSNVSRSRAAWALGELGRELPWGPLSQSIHKGLLVSIEKPMSNRTLYHVIEAIAKVYIHHPHTTEENLQTIRVFNSIRNAKMGEARPVFTLVRSRIETIDVLIVLLKESIDLASKGEERLLSVYRASLDMLRFLESHQSVIESDYDSQKGKIKAALNQLTRGFDLKERMLTVMSLWYISKVARTPQMAQLLQDDLLAYKPNHPSERLFLSSAMAQLQMSKPFKSALLEQLNGKETDAKRLAILCGLRFKAQDLLQHSFDITPNQSKSP